jgi:hypothetical protein
MVERDRGPPRAEDTAKNALIPELRYNSVMPENLAIQYVTLGKPSGTTAC